MKKLTNLRIEAELLEKFQRHARRRGETFTEWAIMAMRESYLNQKNSKIND